MESSPSDPYSRLQYRRLIAWPARIEREWPLLGEALESGPSRRLLDLGCGTGEHARFLAAKGFEVVGVDRSEAQLEEARRQADSSPGAGVRFVRGDLARIGEIEDPAVSQAGFGGAVCLGNTLPHLTDREGLASLAAGLRRLLLPGAPWLIQVLNYERIFERGERHLPLNFRPQDDGGELVFLRLLETREDGHVIFCPTTLRLSTGDETPVEVISSRRVLLRGWRRPELEEIFDEAGFRRREAFGGYGREPYEPSASQDLLLIVR